MFLRMLEPHPATRTSLYELGNISRDLLTTISKFRVDFQYSPTSPSSMRNFVVRQFEANSLELIKVTLNLLISISYYCLPQSLVNWIRGGYVVMQVLQIVQNLFPITHSRVTF